MTNTRDPIIPTAELRSLFENMEIPFSYYRMIYDESGRAVDYVFLAVNRAFEQETGRTRGEVVGKTALEAFPETEPHWIECFGRVARSGEAEQIMDYSAALEKWYSLRAYSPAPDHVAVTVSDVTRYIREQDMLKHTTKELRAQQKENYRLAHEESITGLPNRICLYEAIAELKEKREITSFSVAIFAPDNLAEILAAYGSALSDTIMRAIAQRVSALFFAPSACFSMTGTDLVLLLSSTCDVNEVRLALTRAQKAICNPVDIDGATYYITASCGVACYPNNGVDHEDLITKANLSLYQAKRIGEPSVFYDETIGEAVFRRTQIRNALPKALENKEFELYFQPQIRAHSDRLVGFEALLRWHSPSIGDVAPLEFIDIAEESRLILPLGGWVLLHACRTLRAINEECHTNYMMAVNVSGVQLRAENFVDQVMAVLRETGIPPGLLELEVTESVLLNRELHAIEKINALRAHGIRIALDDFGTGYSSLSLLKDLNISTLKIDKLFVHDLSAIGLTKMIVRLAHLLGAEVVAEGVETEQQMRALRRVGCERVQGYYKALPMPLETLKHYIAIKTNR